MKIETITEDYKDCQIKGNKYSYEDGRSAEYNFLLYYNGKFLFADGNTIDGGSCIGDIRQAINEGKKNVDSLIKWVL